MSKTRSGVFSRDTRVSVRGTWRGGRRATNRFARVFGTLVVLLTVSSLAASGLILVWAWTALASLGR
jgi:hypothetical protein